MVTRAMIVMLFTIGAMLSVVPSFASARGELLASRTLASLDGPETKLYCKKMWKTNGFKCSGFKCRKTTWSGCLHHAIDLKRHRFVARMYGPASVTNADQQLKTIANSCLIAGVALAGIPAVMAAPLGDVSVQTFKAGVQACLSTQNALGGLVASGFEVTIDHEEFFEH